MSASRVAARYARAYVDLLAERKKLDEAREFIAFCELVAGHHELAALFANVTVSVKNKRAVTTALAGRLQLPEFTKRLLETLADNGRIGLLDDMKTAVTARLNEINNVTTVRLTAASEPDPARMAEFEKSIKRLTGGEIIVETAVDPSILGGAVARVGSVIYDGSVSGRLEKIRKELVKES